MVSRYWFIYIFDIINYKNYFFHTEISYNNNSYYSECMYLFLLKKLCWFYKPNRGKKPHPHEKTGGCSRSSRPFMCLIYDWPHDCSDQGCEEIIRWLAIEVWQFFHHNIYVFNFLADKMYIGWLKLQCVLKFIVTILVIIFWNLTMF